jgi:hypothetical protein
MAILGKRTQVVDDDLNQAGFARPPHDAIVERAAKEVGEDGEDVNSHDDAGRFDSKGFEVSRFKVSRTASLKTQSSNWISHYLFPNADGNLET